MQHKYLPKESPISGINKSILRTIWNNKLIVKALDVKNETEARKWFSVNGDAHEYFERLNRESENKMEELQDKAKIYLRSKVTLQKQREKRQGDTSLSNKLKS